MHAVDSTGRLYNMEGKQESWWPRHLEDVFLFKSKCFVEQYATATNASSIEYGSLTLSENIADNAGLQAAFRGYQIRKEGGHDLPGLEFLSDHQLFFIGFARSFCANAKEEALELQLKIDSHSPSKTRINLAVSNSPFFAQAFQCSPKATLARPDQRCALW